MSKQIYWNDELYHGTYRKRHYNYFTSDNNGNLKSVSYPEWKKQQSKPTRKRGSNSTLGSYDKGMTGYSTKDRRAYYHWYYENYKKKNRKIGNNTKRTDNKLVSNEYEFDSGTPYKEFVKKNNENSIRNNISKRLSETLDTVIKDIDDVGKKVSKLMPKVNTAIGFTTAINNSTMRGNPVFSITNKFSLAVGSLISAVTKSNGSKRRKTNHMTL